MSASGTALPRRVRIIDGAVGTEIQRRGVALHPSYWSALAHITHPDTVLEVHRDYLEAGATVVSANSFMAGRHVLEAGGVDDFEAVNRAAMATALRARDEQGDADVLVAGTLSTLPPFDRADRLPLGPAIRDNFRRQARILAAAGADFLLAEMLLETESAAALLEACCETGRPVWAGVSASRDPATGLLRAFRAPDTLFNRPWEPLAKLIGTVAAHPIEALGIMHTSVPIMPDALEALAETWAGPMFAYASTGVSNRESWTFPDLAEPEAYAEAAAGWVAEHHLVAVGGCCGTGPAHVRALRARLAASTESPRARAFP